MRAVRLAVCFLACCTVLWAQQPQTPGTVRLMHPIGLGAESAASAPSRHIRALGLLVEFQEDFDPRTTGTGMFDRYTGDPQHIDPAPHDTAYFAFKLRFLENYYRKVSRGQLTISSDLFPAIIRLPDSMSTYAPARAGTDASLVQFVSESWGAAGALMPGFPFAAYDVYIIFHAGAGRDVDLVSLVGYDPTPFDIPSLTLDLRAMQRLLDDPGYPGIPVGSGPAYIGNTLIIPETETRVLDTGFGPDTLQLGINGLLAASLGSYLGLPDLFDTKTGRSGIGQFGLMDGASIFAFSGLFPPEPSAWEKVHLGWVTPTLVPQGSARTLSLPAAGLSASSPDSVAKLEISSSEYFLIENRQRDPNKNGQRLTLFQGGTLVERSFVGDTTGFQIGDVSGIGGSVVDVEDFDWALPGATSQSGFEGGGILIWHIDENVIRNGLESNEVNANPEKRGVDLEEADGSQDIGQQYEVLQAGSGTEFGWPLDAWYEGNPAPAFEGLFGPSTFPDTRSNTGALTLVTVTDFGPRDSVMYVTVTTGNSLLSPLPALERRMVQQEGIPPFATTGSGFYVAADAGLLAMTPAGTERIAASLVPARSFARPRGIAALDALHPSGTESFVLETGDSSYRLVRLVDVLSNGPIDTVSVLEGSFSERITSVPAMAGPASLGSFLVGTESGKLIRVEFASGTQTLMSSGAGGPVTSIAQLPPAVAGPAWDVYSTSGNTLVGHGASVLLPDSATDWSIVGVSTPDGPMIVAAGGSTVIGYSPDLSSVLFRAPIAPAGIRSIASADLDRDGKKEFVVTTPSSIAAFSQQGVLLPGFPVTLPDGDTFSGPVLIGDAAGEEDLELVTISGQGKICLWDVRGIPVSGYPLQAFDRGQVDALLFQTSTGQAGIAGVSASVADSGRVLACLRAFALASPFVADRFPWTANLGNGARWGADLSTTADPAAPSSEYLPAARVYNWPNPVYGSSTRIRFYVPEDSDVSVEIIDVSGMKIADLSGRAVGGVEGEIAWNVEGIQSGVYLARVHAAGASGSASRIIKIAVIK